MICQDTTIFKPLLLSKITEEHTGGFMTHIIMLSWLSPNQTTVRYFWSCHRSHLIDFICKHFLQESLCFAFTFVLQHPGVNPKQYGAGAGADRVYCNINWTNNLWSKTRAVVLKDLCSQMCSLLFISLHKSLGRFDRMWVLAILMIS